MVKLLIVLSTIIASFASGSVINKCVNNGMLSLTFDNGPADYTVRILESLAKSNVTATFHIQTNYFTDPTIVSKVKQISAQGHLIGISGNPNTDYRVVSSTDIVTDFKRAAVVIASLTGYWPRTVRLPFNKFDSRVVGALEGAGFFVTQHNLDSFDYTVPDSDKIYSSFQLSFALYANGAGNFIALMHDAVEANVKAIPNIVDLAISKGYKIVRLDECIGAGNLTESTTKVDLPTGSLLPTTLTSSSSTTKAVVNSQTNTSSGASINSNVFQFVAAVLAIFGAYIFFL